MAIIVPMQVTATNESVPVQVEENAENLPAAIDLRIGYKGEKGDTGVGIASCVLNPDYTLTITLTDGTSYTTESIRGAQGEKGADGVAGKDGKDGKDGINGKDGADGKNGKDGLNGQDGQDGADGFSPTATVTKSGKVVTITITDKNGTTTQTVSDGNDGQNGQDGTNGQDGAAGQDGKSAYQYAVDGGYTGTEQEFAAKMAAEIPTKTSQLTNDSGYMTGLFLASYGHTTFADIKAAYLANKIVYCKASSGSNPGSGSQLRQAFLAYIGGSEENPTSFEFQYYRSVTSHSDSQQGDQVFIYTINSSSTWSVTTREAYTKIVAGTGLTSSYSNGKLTLSLS